MLFFRRCLNISFLHFLVLPLSFLSVSLSLLKKKKKKMHLSHPYAIGLSNGVLPPPPTKNNNKETNRKQQQNKRADRKGESNDRWQPRNSRQEVNIRHPRPPFEGTLVNCIHETAGPWAVDSRLWPRDLPFRRRLPPVFILFKRGMQIAGERYIYKKGESVESLSPMTFSSTGRLYYTSFLVRSPKGQESSEPVWRSGIVRR